MKKANDNWKTDSRPPRKGWAPGEYISPCNTCKSSFMGEKRAYMCADCAYANYDEEVAFEKQLDVDMLELKFAVESVVRICHKYNAHWWVDPVTGEDLRKNPLILPTKQLLIVSEVTEAMEADRKDLMDDSSLTFPVSSSKRAMP